MAYSLKQENQQEAYPEQGESKCETEATLDLISGKWKIFILWHLGTGGTHRFSELQRAIPKISHKMLMSQLRELIDDELVQREVFPEIPPKVEYSMTEIGKTLLPLILMMNKWGKNRNMQQE